MEILKVHIILPTLCINLAVPLGPNSNACYIGDSDGSKTLYCCANHQLVNGKCEVCPVGYIGIGGKCDTPCPEEYFGLQCVKKCKCQSNQRCHNINGCVCEDPSMNCTDDKNLQSESGQEGYLVYNKTLPEIGHTACYFEMTVIICCAVLAMTMLAITTSSLFWKRYLG